MVDFKAGAAAYGKGRAMLIVQRHKTVDTKSVAFSSVRQRPCI